MSAINESLRKLEERGALASTALPAGVVVPTAPASGAFEPPVASNRPMLYLMVLLTVIWVIWSEWDRRHPVVLQTGPQPAPVAAVVVPPSARPVESAPQDPVTAAKPTVGAQMAAPKPVSRKDTASNAPQAPPTVPTTSLVQAPAPTPATHESAVAIERPASPRRSPVVLPSEPVSKVTTPRQRADVLYTQALRKLQEGRASDGRAALQELLSESPGHDDARQLLAALLLEDRQWARAETLLQDGLAHQPTAAALLMLARLKVERGEDVAALRILTEHQGRGQTDAEYRAFMAVLLVRQDRMSEAVEHYRFAVDRQPGRGAWWAGLGLALAAQPAQSSAALQALERARTLGGLAGPVADRVDARLAELQKDERKP